MNSLTFGELQSLVAARTAGNVEDAAEREAYAAAQRGLQPLSAVDGCRAIHDVHPFTSCAGRIDVSLDGSKRTWRSVWLTRRILGGSDISEVRRPEFSIRCRDTALVYDSSASAQCASTIVRAGPSRWRVVVPRRALLAVFGLLAITIAGRVISAVPVAASTTEQAAQTPPASARPAIVMPAAGHAAGSSAGYAGSDTCVICHSDKGDGLKGTAHGRPTIRDRQPRRTAARAATARARRTSTTTPRGTSGSSALIKPGEVSADVPDVPQPRRARGLGRQRARARATCRARPATACTARSRRSTSS